MVRLMGRILLRWRRVGRERIGMARMRCGDARIDAKRDRD
jgi:hypothetical protein